MPLHTVLDAGASIRVLSATRAAVLGPTLDRATFLLVAFLTHAAVGYALVTVTTETDPRLGLVFGLLPDVDFLFPAALGFPFVHRGLTHTPLFALLVVGAVFVVSRKTALASGVALFSHLCIDALSPAGIMWLYPITRSPSPGLPVHGPAGTAVLWVGVVVLLAVARRQAA